MHAESFYQVDSESAAKILDDSWFVLFSKLSYKKLCCFVEVAYKCKLKINP